MEDQTVLTEFKIRPCGFREAIAAAINAEGRHLMIDSRTIHVTASPEDAFAPIRRDHARLEVHRLRIADALVGVRRSDCSDCFPQQLK